MFFFFYEAAAHGFALVLAREGFGLDDVYFVDVLLFDNWVGLWETLIEACFAYIVALYVLFLWMR